MEWLIISIVLVVVLIASGLFFLAGRGRKITRLDDESRQRGGSIAVADAPAGRRAVRSLKQRGYDFVKVYSRLPRDAYFAIADEAKKQRIPFAGHVPQSVSVAEASDAGQKSIEHLTGILAACSSRVPGGGRSRRAITRLPSP